MIKERLDELPPGEEARLLDPTPATDAPAGESDGPTPAVVVTTGSTKAAHHRAAARAGARRRSHPPCPSTRASPTTTCSARPDAEAQYYAAPSSSPPPGSSTRSCRELESYGLVAPSREVDGVAQYDDDAVEVARIAAGFFRRGIEARHLRMYRTSPSGKRCCSGRS